MTVGEAREELNTQLRCMADEIRAWGTVVDAKVDPAIDNLIVAATRTERARLSQPSAVEPPSGGGTTPFRGLTFAVEHPLEFSGRDKLTLSSGDALPLAPTPPNTLSREQAIAKLIAELADDHGDDHHEDGCPICEAIVVIQASPSPGAVETPQRRAVDGGWFCKCGHFFGRAMDNCDDCGMVRPEPLIVMFAHPDVWLEASDKRVVCEFPSRRLGDEASDFEERKVLAQQVRDALARGRRN